MGHGRCGGRVAHSILHAAVMNRQLGEGQREIGSWRSSVLPSTIMPLQVLIKARFAMFVQAVGLSLSDQARLAGNMGLGVLDDAHLELVPGTALLTDIVGADHHHHRGGLDTSVLKHAKGRNSDVVLVPQPSLSPNDPLNCEQSDLGSSFRRSIF